MNTLAYADYGFSHSIGTKRSTPPKAVVPTSEQIAARVAKARERWKSPLSDKRNAPEPPPIPPSPPPIPLRSNLRRFKSYEDPPRTTDTPTTSFDRNGAISPSVYSRTTGFKSPQPFDSVASLCETPRQPAPEIGRASC